MSLRGVISQGRISTYPSVPCTRIRCPSAISRVASSTPTTAGRPYSRAITAPCVISPPTSVTRPATATERRPAGVGVGRDEDVARLEVGPGHVQDDAGAPLDGPGGDRQAGQGTGRHVVATVLPGDGL